MAREAHLPSTSPSGYTGRLKIARGGLDACALSTECTQARKCGPTSVLRNVVNAGGTFSAFSTRVNIEGKSSGFAVFLGFRGVGNR